MWIRGPRPPRLTGAWRGGWGSVCIAGLLLAGCAAAPQPRPDIPWETYSGLVVPAPVLPFQAEGSAMIRYRGERETGSIHLEGTGQGRYLLRLSARVLGTTALEIRFDDETLLILDYTEDASYRGANSAENRLRVFALDMTPTDFLMAVTGRVPRDQIPAGQGVDGQERVEFRLSGGDYRFTLGNDGLPTEWEKRLNGVLQFRVQYREYMDVDTGGTPLRVPRKIRIYHEDGELLAVLGMGTFEPWRAAGEIELSGRVASDLDARPLEMLAPR